MTRTQVQLTDHQLQALRQASASTGRSIADLIREAVDQYMAGQIERAIRVTGTFSSGRTDVSANHDQHLTVAFAS
jgi:predicted DNA-binding protein